MAQVNKVETAKVSWVYHKMFLLLLMLYALPPLKVVSQENDKPDPAIWGFQIGNAGIWTYQEIDLSKSISLRNEVGFDTGAHGYNMQYLSGLSITPTFSLEPRWYYDIKKKVKNTFEAVHNSANFLLLRVTYNPDFKIISTEAGRSVASNVSLIPTWGIRRMLSESINFEAGIGMGYSYTIKSDFSNPDRHIGIVNLHLRLGMDF